MYIGENISKSLKEEENISKSLKEITPSEEDFLTDKGYQKGRNNVQWWIMLLKNFPIVKYVYWRNIEIKTHCDSSDIIEEQIILQNKTPFSILLYPLYYHSYKNKGYWFSPQYDYTLLEIVNSPLYKLRNEQHLIYLKEKENYTPFI